MNQNRLIINQRVGTNVVEYELDLFDNVPLPINKSIIDIQNVAERKSDFTKTITLPGTNNNNDIFSNIFNLARSVKNTNTYNFAPDFNPNLKADAILYKNGVPMIQGYLQLTNINIVDEYQIEYEIIIIGRTANLFTDLGEKKLNEIDLSAYNHTWNFTNIQNSWTPNTTLGYYYGLIDYGLSNDQKGFYTVDQKPQIFAKAIIDAIFKDAGYRYDSTFFTSSPFTKLVVPTTQDKLYISTQQVTDRTFKGDRLSDSSLQPIFDTGKLYSKLPFDNVGIQSTPSGYSNSTFEFTVQTEGFYEFGININLYCKQLSTVPYVKQWFDIVKTNPGTGEVICGTMTSFATSRNSDFTINQGYECPKIYCLYGEKIEVRMYSISGRDWDYQLLSGSSFYSIPSAELILGDTVKLQNCLPNDIKQSEFLASIIKMFNLYVSVDSLDNKKLRIETRDVYFTNTTVDLTNKVDVSKGVKVQPLGANKYKDYTFQMKEDKDEINEEYQSQYAYPYGTYKKTVDNDFMTESYKTEVVFAPTPLYQFRDSRIVTTKIAFKNSNGTSTPGTSKLRLLVAGGLSASMGTNYFHFEDPDKTLHYFNSYAYVGHYDNTLSPTFDINFDVPKEIRYKNGYQTVLSPNTLYNLYHKKGIEEITNKDSKLVTYYLKLNENEINKLSFRNQYFIDKQYFRLYELDFDANSDEPAKLTFLKLATVEAFVPYNLVVNGGGNGGTTYSKNLIRNGTDFPKGADVIGQGSGNTLEGYEQLINSTNNYVNASQVNVLGGGNNNLIDNNATYINTNNYESVRSGEVVINNIDQPLLSTKILSVADVQDLHNTPFEILAIQDGYWTEIYDAYITVFFDGTFPKQGYNSAKLHLEFNGEGSKVVEFDNGITGAVVATKQKGINNADKVFLNLAVMLHTAGNLGASGNSQFKIELEYRLHPIID